MNSKHVMIKVTNHKNFSSEGAWAKTLPMRRIYAVYAKMSGYRPILIWLHDTKKWIVQQNAADVIHWFRNKDGDLEEEFNFAWVKDLAPQELVFPNVMAKYNNYGEKYERAKLVARLTGKENPYDKT